MRRKKTLTLR